MDPLAIAEQAPVLTLRNLGVQQAGKPHEGHTEAPAIGELHRKLVVANRHLHGSRVDARA